MNPSDDFSKIASKRYQLIRKLGQGGMGAVYHVLDRLLDEYVALKRVTASADHLIFASRTGTIAEIELSLVNEFKMLSSLRHPNIIRVLDYGFNAKRQPYFTMDLLPEIQTITQAGQHLSLQGKVNLLLQTLQALFYLHHRGILHRDLKPENIAVLPDGTLKVLDFGLAAQSGHHYSGGTLVYMPPEVLSDQLVTEASDLYSFGVIAYQMFSGQLPFESPSPAKLIAQILYQDVPPLEIEPSIAHIIGRLLAKEAEDRYASAREAMNELADAAGVSFSLETLDIRESFIQTAPFVERQMEMAQLETALEQAANQQGSAWLVGGESGVGKSRLFYELRTRALVRGIAVISGQASRESARLYQMWREPLRWLALLGEVTDEEAPFLKPFVDDIERLVNREIADPPPLAPELFREKLTTVILNLLRRLEQPVLLMFEDIQWASEDSLALLGNLSEEVQNLTCLIIGNYRNDERPDLPSFLPHPNRITLRRFEKSAIDILSKKILGDADPRLVDFLERETEGNLFFIVEVMRELAEIAGELGQVKYITLPTHILTNGIQTIIERRLKNVPTSHRALLDAAAIAGREVDLEMLAAFDPSAHLEAWLVMCQSVAVLDVEGIQWRFAHDKIRESLLSSLTEEETETLHRRVALAIEAAYPDTARESRRLTLHWEQAGDDTKAAYYAVLAADEAIRDYAYTQARFYLNKALKLQNDRDQRIDLLIKLVNVSFISASPEVNLSLLNEVHELMEGDENADWLKLFNVHYALGRTYYYSTRPQQSLEHFHQMRLIARKAGDSQREAYALSMVARSLSLQGHFKEALNLLDAFDALEQLGLWSDWVINKGYLGFCQVMTGDVEAGIETGLQALARAETLNHPSVKAVSLIFLTMSHWQTGDYDKALNYAAQTIEISEQSGDRMPMHLGYGFRAWVYSRMGQHQAAWDDFQEYETLVGQLGGRLVYADWFMAARAELYLNSSSPDEAVEAAREALKFADEVGGLFAMGIAYRVLALAEKSNEAETLLLRSIKAFESGSAHFETVHTRNLLEQLRNRK